VPVYHGTATPSAYYLGSTTVSKLYFGATQVWPVAAAGPLLSIQRLAGGTNVSDWTVSGANSSTFSRAAGYNDDDTGGLLSYRWNAIGTATVTVKFDFSDDWDGTGSAYIFKNGNASGNIVHTVSQGTNITRAVSVVTGDWIMVYSSKVDGNQFFSNVVISAA
jgi:hypothetical protein